jgi:hypothetical protein
LHFGALAAKPCNFAPRLPAKGEISGQNGALSQNGLPDVSGIKAALRNRQTFL